MEGGCVLTSGVFAEFPSLLPRLDVPIPPDRCRDPSPGALGSAFLPDALTILPKSRVYPTDKRRRRARSRARNKDNPGNETNTPKTTSLHYILTQGFGQGFGSLFRAFFFPVPAQPWFQSEIPVAKVMRLSAEGAHRVAVAGNVRAVALSLVYMCMYGPCLETGHTICDSHSDTRPWTTATATGWSMALPGRTLLILAQAG